MQEMRLGVKQLELRIGGVKVSSRGGGIALKERYPKYNRIVDETHCKKIFVIWAQVSVSLLERASAQDLKQWD